LRKKENPMKKAALFASILALALSARAQTVNFAALPAVSSPTLLPSGYDKLDWSGFYYVDPIWSGAGIGFKQGPNALDVAYMGGGECEKAGVSCSASISSINSAANAVGGGFRASSAIVAGGYHSEIINVIAYSHGKFVGSQTYNLSTSLQQINFPASWGMITQLVMDTNSGTLVLYALNLQSVGPTAHAMASPRTVAANAEDSSVGPTAPIHVVDPGYQAADSDTVSPPIIIIGPNASRKAAPVARGSENAKSDIGTVSPPIIIIGPNAPKKPGPVTRDSANGISHSATANAVSVGPTAKLVGPTASKSVSATAHEAPRAAAGANAISVGPTAGKSVGPTASKSVSATARHSNAGGGAIGPPISATGPNAVSVGPTADKDVGTNAK
jgi:hypothetical protein